MTPLRARRREAAEISIPLLLVLPCSSSIIFKTLFQNHGSSPRIDCLSYHTGEPCRDLMLHDLSIRLGFSFLESHDGLVNINMSSLKFLCVFRQELLCGYCNNASWLLYAFIAMKRAISLDLPYSYKKDVTVQHLLSLCLISERIFLTGKGVCSEQNISWICHNNISLKLLDLTHIWNTWWKCFLSLL